MDRRCDNRLTVIEAVPTTSGHTRIEAWATQAGHGIVRMRFTVQGPHPVEFGWLVAFEVAGYATIFAHEDAPGKSVKVRGEIRELGPVR